MILDLAPSCVSAPAKQTGAVPGCGVEWRPIADVLRLSTRAKSDPSPRQAARLHAITGIGLAGDRHASKCSPRQLLVAGSTAYDRFEMERDTLRENVLIDFPTEQLKSGDLLRIGDVVLWLTFQCEPCSLLERRKSGIVKAIGKQRGILARVLVGGELQVNAAVYLGQLSLQPMSDDWRQRVRAVVESIPEGRYITYRALAEMAGIATAYCRAFPKVLSCLPRHLAVRVRAASASGPGELWDGATLYDAPVFVKA